MDSPETFVAQNQVVGVHGHFSIDALGAWSYTASSAHDEFVKDQVYSDTFTVAAVDGTQTTVTVNITGANDVATLSSETKELIETNEPLRTGGTLVLSDVDATAATVVAQSGTLGGYGTFVIGTDGVWSYTTTDALNHLNANQVVTEARHLHGLIGVPHRQPGLGVSR